MNAELRREPQPGRDSLQISVTSGQHRGKAGGLFLAPALLTRLFVMPVAANDAQRAFAINLLLETAQGFFHWLAFF